MWQESIEAIDKLIELYQKYMELYPEDKDFYERRIAVRMQKKLLAQEALKKTEELRDIVDEYLEPEEETVP